jgi:hypothetical protein
MPAPSHAHIQSVPLASASNEETYQCFGTFDPRDKTHLFGDTWSHTHVVTKDMGSTIVLIEQVRAAKQGCAIPYKDASRMTYH